VGGAGGDRCRQCGAREFLDGRDEPIAAALDRDDVLVKAGLVVENLAESGDVAREVIFLDDRIGPHQLSRRSFSTSSPRRSIRVMRTSNDFAVRLMGRPLRRSTPIAGSATNEPNA
jgi:hypothetical protein